MIEKQPVMTTQFVLRDVGGVECQAQNSQASGPDFSKRSCPKNHRLSTHSNNNNEEVKAAAPRPIMTSRLILVIGDLFIPDRAPVSGSTTPLLPGAQG